MIGVPSILLGIFYGRNDVKGMYVHERSRAPSGAIRSVYEFHWNELRIQTGAYWGPIDKYLLHCIRTLRTGFERIKPRQRYIFFDMVFDVVRIRLECIRSRGSPSLERSRGSLEPNYESHLEHMEQPFDMFYSIAFERFEPGSNESNPFKGISSLIWYLIQLEHNSNPVRIHSFTTPDGGVVKTNRLILHCIRTFFVHLFVNHC